MSGAIVRMLCLVLASTAAGANGEEGRATMTSYAFLMETTTAGDSLVVMVQPEEAEVTVPLATAGPRQEIGWYQTERPEPAYRALHRELIGSEPSSAPDDPMDAGALTGSIALMEEGQPRVMHTYPLEQHPERIDALREAFLDVMREVLAHPRRVVRARASWSEPSFPHDDDLRFDLTLENVGSDPIRIGAPGFPDGAMTLVLFRAGPDGAPELFRDVALAPADVRRSVEGAAPQPLDAGDPTLQPGEKLVLQVGRALRLPPATYTAFVRYESVGGEAAEGFVRGTVEAGLGSVRITADAR